jgi:multidrug efflux system membrane fusion protein
MGGAHHASARRGAPLALAMLLAACSGERAPPPPAPAPVTVVEAQARDMPRQVDAVGTVEAINSVAVKSLAEGQLERVFVHDGQDVAEGQPLFRIDPRPAEAALREAQAALAKERAALAQARSQVERYGPVAEKHYISADQMEQYRTQLASARAGVAVGEANVASARLALGHTDIRAPIAGRIGRILVQPGNLVKPNDAALVVINQVAPVYVTFALPGRLLGPVLAAQSNGPLAVRAEIEGVPGAFDGELAFVDNAVDSATGTIRLRGRFANERRLLWPGQIVAVRLVLGHDAAAVVLPDQAVQTGPDGRYVFVVDEGGIAHQRAVEVARHVDGDAVIASGLAAGERVVLDGQSRVEDGARVAVRP